MEFSITEVVGYAASALVAVSMMMSNVLKLRVINLVGAVAFAAYGALVGAYPVLIVNAFIAVVDVYYLARLLYDSEVFELVHITDPAAPWPNQFVSFYRADIEQLFPGFDLPALSAPSIVMIRRNMVAVGMFVYRHVGGGELAIDLDYVAPEWRDLRSARFLYAKGAELCKTGECDFWSVHTADRRHARYLRRLGFSPDGADPTRYTRPV